MKLDRIVGILENKQARVLHDSWEGSPIGLAGRTRYLLGDQEVCLPPSQLFFEILDKKATKEFGYPLFVRDIDLTKLICPKVTDNEYTGMVFNLALSYRITLSDAIKLFNDEVGRMPPLTSLKETREKAEQQKKQDLLKRFWEELFYSKLKNAFESSKSELSDHESQFLLSHGLEINLSIHPYLFEQIYLGAIKEFHEEVLENREIGILQGKPLIFISKLQGMDGKRDWSNEITYGGMKITAINGISSRIKDFGYFLCAFQRTDFSDALSDFNCNGYWNKPNSTEVTYQIPKISVCNA